MVRKFIFATVMIAGGICAAQAACTPDPAGNEPTCGHEAQMTVARHHGFEDMAHATMSKKIYASPQLKREADKAFKACMTRHNYCPL
jgi:hypothetical protein